MDPGKVTGYGFLDASAGALPAFQGGELGHDAFLDAAVHWVPGVDLVVCEDFKVNQRTAQTLGGDRLWSTEQIGCLRTWCRWASVEFRLQPASDKTFGSDAKLKAIGWWKGATGERGHRRDAARHAITYLVNTRQVDTRVFL